MKRSVLIIICLLAAGAASAGDLTPYRISVGGNGCSYYGGWTSITRKQFVEMYDLVGAFTYLKDCYDTAGVYKPAMREFLSQYMSPHEPNLYYTSGSSYSYNQRLTLATPLSGPWFYAYMKEFMDSIEVSVESLMTHIADTNYTIRCNTEGVARGVKGYGSYRYYYTFPASAPYYFIKTYPDGHADTATHSSGSSFDTTIAADQWVSGNTYDLRLRCYYNSTWNTIGQETILDTIGGLGNPGFSYEQKRTPYQYFNNTSSDTFAYPGGYVWIPNIGSMYYRRAAVYAIKRHFLEDSAATSGGPGSNGHWGGFFYDNYQGTVPVFNSYYDWKSSSGGPTSGYDLVEYPDFEGASSSALWWQHAWTLAHDLDTALALWNYHGTLNSVPAGDANAVALFTAMAPYIHNVSFESPPSWNAYSGTGFGKMKWQYDVCRTDSIWNQTAFQVANFYSATPGEYGYDTLRINLFYYGFWLIIRTPLSFYNAFRCWDVSISMFQQQIPVIFKNFGEASDLPQIYDSTSCGAYCYTYLMWRPYDSGNVRIYSRTCYAGSDFSDVRTITPGGTWYKMDPSTATFGSTPITSFDIRPGESVILANEPNWAGPYESQPYGYIYDESSPTISRSPSSFTFTATAGGSNPANQTLTISNSGGGTLNWSLSDDAAWLSEGTPSGSGNGSSSVIVNISGLSAGTYNATITITDENATNNPQTASVSLTVSEAGGDPSPTATKRAVRRG